MSVEMKGRTTMLSFICRFGHLLKGETVVRADKLSALGFTIVTNLVSAFFQTSYESTLLCLGSIGFFYLALRLKNRTDAGIVRAGQAENSSVSEPRTAPPGSPTQDNATNRLEWQYTNNCRKGFATIGVLLLGISIIMAFSARENDRYVAQLIFAKLTRVESRQVDQSAQLERIEQNTTKLAQDTAEIRNSLEQKPTSLTPDLRPTVNLPVQAASERVAQNPDASVLARVEAAIVSRSPDAQSMLDQLDAMVESTDFKRRQLRGDFHYFRGEYDLAVEPYEHALSLRSDDIRARNDVVLARVKARSGDIGTHRRRAIDIAEETLDMLPRDTFDWARTKINLGTAWAGLPTVDRGKTLRKAIKCYNDALRVCTQEEHPVQWAHTQNNLGNAWRNMPTNERENIDKAIEYYKNALVVFTQHDYPVEWAMTQINYGNTLQRIPTGNKCNNIKMAIEHYNNALKIFNLKSYRVEWALTQNNLGNARLNMPCNNRVMYINKAIEHFRKAQKVFSLQDHPLEWSKTQNNLGNAWSRLPSDNSVNDEKAIECYKAALDVYEEQNALVYWAETQLNLAEVLARLSDDKSDENISEAIERLNAALTVLTREYYPDKWALVQCNLGATLLDAIEFSVHSGSGVSIDDTRNAINHFKAALEILTLKSSPIEWARTMNGLGTAFFYRSYLMRNERCSLLREALACFKAALTVRTPEALPREHESTMDNQGIVRQAYEAADCADEMPFDAIAPAQ